MPIYAYRCDACGHQKDVLQKMSDPTLTVCPSCGAESFAKQLSAPAFQLKGTGWYVTDFRDKANKANGGGKSAGDGAKAHGPCATGFAIRFKEPADKVCQTVLGNGGEAITHKADSKAASPASGTEGATPAVPPAATAAKSGAESPTTAGGASAA